jgi:DNA polymerase (family 10)
LTVLAKLDFVIGSIHSHFEMDEAQMTNRMIRALENPYVTMLGHPTGRILLKREGYRVNLPRVIDAAVRLGKGIEINAHPTRLDLDSTHARLGGEKGLTVSLNPDAHATQGIADFRWGILVARRAGLSKASILNALPLPKLRAALLHMRGKVD